MVWPLPDGSAHAIFIGGTDHPVTPMASTAVRRKRAKRRTWEHKKRVVYMRLSGWPTLAALNRRILVEGFPKSIEVDEKTWFLAYFELCERCHRLGAVFVGADPTGETFMYMGCVVKVAQ